MQKNRLAESTPASQLCIYFLKVLPSYIHRSMCESVCCTARESASTYDGLSPVLSQPLNGFPVYDYTPHNLYHMTGTLPFPSRSYVWFESDG